MHHRLKAVFFHLDETLFDHRHSSRMGLATLQRRYPLLRKKPVELLELELWEILNATHLQIMQGELTPGEGRLQRLTALFAGCGLKVSPAEMESAALVYKTVYRQTRRAVPGMLEVVKYLKAKQYPIAVITNNFHDEQTDKLRICNMDGYVDHLISAEQFGIGKPDPRIFRYALELFQVSAPEAAMVGDSWESDIMGAEPLGIRPIWLNRRRQPCPAANRCVEIKEALELLTLL
jgi:HAD superfamily hydrolase (TIGR01549 family)